MVAFGLSGMIGRHLIEGASRDEMSKYRLHFAMFKAPDNFPGNDQRYYYVGKKWVVVYKLVTWLKKFC